jgi:hypothetical protein
MPEASTLRSMRPWRGWSGARAARSGFRRSPSGLGALGRRISMPGMLDTILNLD